MQMLNPKVRAYQKLRKQEKSKAETAAKRARTVAFGNLVIGQHFKYRDVEYVKAHKCATPCLPPGMAGGTPKNFLDSVLVEVVP